MTKTIAHHGRKVTLRTPAQEASLCRRAWKDVGPNHLGWHIHHTELIESMEGAEKRIEYIETAKPERERSLRLRLMRPVKDTKAYAAIDRRYLKGKKKRDTTIAFGTTEFWAEGTRLNEEWLAALHLLHAKECGCGETDDILRLLRKR